MTGAGALFVWRGGPGLRGPRKPSAILGAPAPGPGDGLGGGVSGHGVLFGDVNGDGFPNVVAGAALADAGSVLDSGSVHVWSGGPGLAGNRPAEAVLAVPGAAANDALGVTSGQGLRLVDLDGDRILDLLVGARRADAQGVPDAGALYLWTSPTGSPLHRARSRCPAPRPATSSAPDARRGAASPDGRLERAARVVARVSGTTGAAGGAGARTARDPRRARP